MYRIRRSSISEPRFEMTPLMDVIFILLTFFIFSQVLTIKASILPVSLPQLTTGEIATENLMVGITVDQEGKIYFNQNEISKDQLKKRLEEIAKQDDPPKVYLATDSRQGASDRLPIFLEVWDIIRQAGLKEINIVGLPNK